MNSRLWRSLMVFSLSLIAMLSLVSFVGAQTPREGLTSLHTTAPLPAQIEQNVANPVSFYTPTSASARATAPITHPIAQRPSSGGPGKAPGIFERHPSSSGAYTPAGTRPYLPQLADRSLAATAPANNPSALNRLQLNAPLTPPMPGSANLAICLDTDRVWGVVSAGDTITVAVNNQPMGASVADAKGFFWTTLYNSNGDRPGLIEGNVVTIYHGASSGVTLRSINGQVNPLTNIVSGTIGGITSPISVTVYVPGGEPSLTSYSRTVSSNAAGYFIANFSGLFDLHSTDEAVVAYVQNGIEVHRHVHPAQSLFVGQAWQEAGGYTAPGSAVTVTLYLSNSVTAKETITLTASATNGWYYTNFVTDVLDSDVVVVNLANGAVLSRTVDPLTEFVDAVNDRVLGQAKAGAVVLGVADQLTPLGRQNVRIGTTADASGVYTLNFSGLVDIMPGSWAGVYIADPEGDDLNIWQPALGSIEVNQTWNEVAGISAFPPPLSEPQTPVTLTIYNTASASEATYTTFSQRWSWYSFNSTDFPSMPDIVPGDVITVENGPWQGVVHVMTMTVQPDIDLDRFTGTIVSPTNRVELSGGNWNSKLHPIGGWFDTLTTANSPFTATLAAFDLHLNQTYDLNHRTANDYLDRISRETGGVAVLLPNNVVLANFLEPGIAFTITLRDGSNNFKARVAGVSEQPNGFSGQHDFWNTGQRIEVGDHVQVQSAAGFSQSLVIPDLTTSPDTINDRVYGHGPANTLLFVNVDNQGDGYVPTDSNGQFTVALAQLQEFWGDGQLSWGNGFNIYAMDENYNAVLTWFNWPHITARTDLGGGNDVVGYNAFPGNTIYITVTDPGHNVVATGTTTGGTCGGPTDYCLNFPSGTIVPSNTVTVNFGGGYVDSVAVVPVTGSANPSTDLVIGTAPAGGGVHGWAQHRNGGGSNDFSAQVDATGVYTLNFGSQGWDIQYGDEIHVYYSAPHGHEVEYYFWVPAPDVSVNKWNPSGGYARPGGVMVYAVEYSNWGNGDATNTIVTDTLPMYTTYAGDNSGVTPTIGSDNVITWNLGTVVPNADRAFMVTLNVSPSAPTGSAIIPDNCAGIATTSPGDSNPGNDRSCTGPIDVRNDEVEIGVDKWSNPNDPAPGQEFEYTLQVCNNRGAAAGPVWLTDTLPLSTTLVQWWPENQSNNYWTEVSRTGGRLVLYAPGLSGNMCDQVRARLHVDAGVPFFTSLTNSIVAVVAGDVDLNNNQRTNTIHTSPPRYDVTLSKNTNSGVMVPGGWIDYHISADNQGNSPVHAWVTDTLPPGISYQAGSARRENGGPPFPPMLVAGQTIVWDLGTIEVNGHFGLDFSINISSTVTPSTSLNNCATIGLLVPDDTPWDNTSCAAETIYGHGPNLRVIKWSRWENNNRQLRYDARFYNVGDQQIDNVWITETLPVSTTSNGWSMDFDWSRLISNTQSDNELRWEFSTLYAGDNGWLHFGVNLDDPNTRPRWYTNTIEIDTPAGDMAPADNHYSLTNVNGEVNRVELRVANRIDLWGQAQPNSPLTVTTPYTRVTTSVDGNGNWNLYQEGSPIGPGDTVTVTAGNGTLPVVIHVPVPFDIQADSITNRVWGHIDALDHQSIEVDLSGYLTKIAQTDSSGAFTRTFADVPRGGNGEVRYYTTVNDADVVFHRDYQSPDLLMNVNYGDNWIEGNYDAGHTVWITVTQSDGTSIKGSAVLTTGLWNGNTGFSTNWQGWSGGQPDIQPGDWVYGSTENGYTSTVHVGTINGWVNASTDSITGTIDAPWFTQLLDIQCKPWGAPGGAPQKYSTAMPDGSLPYACQWNPLTEWNILPGQNIGVDYVEPDGDQVYNAFHEPAARLNIQTWGNNQPGAGGNYAFTVRYDNQGDASAVNTVITSTLGGVTYLSDSSGDPAFVAGNVITWNVGTVPANSSNQFEIFVHVDATEGNNITNTVEIGTASFDQTNDVSKSASWAGTVQSTNVDVNVGTGTWTWQPAPGYDYIYNANVCNNGSTGSTETTLTNTLPLSTSLVSWWGQNPGWSQVFSATHQLIVSRPTLSGGQCDQVFVRVHLDPAALSGDSLHYMALVGASNDPNSGNNQADLWHNVGGPYYDLSISKNWNWGQLVPGGEVRYNINYNNNGSLPITTTIRITDTLPQNTTFLGAWRYDQQGQHPVTPTNITAGYIVWEIPSLENGFGNNFEIALRLNFGMTSGTVFTNCATIAADFSEYNNPYDNQQCVADTVRTSGPNLRVTKTADWQNGGNQIQYRVRLENIGTTSISSVTVTDTYPVSMTLLPGWNINWPGHANNDSLNHTFTVTLDSPFNPGNAADLNMQFNVPNVPNGTFFTNTAEITTPPGDVNPADNLAQQVSATGPDLSVEKWLTGGSATPRPGELLTYTLHLADKSTQWRTSGQTLITDTLPTGLEFVAVRQRLCGPGNFFCDNNPTQAGSVLTWTWGSWCANCWNDLILTVRVTDTARFGDVLANTVQIASDNPTTDVEPDYMNNTSTVIVRVMNPQFAVGKVYQGNRVAGTAVTYTLTVTNQGNFTGTNVRLIDQLPSYLTYSGGDGTYGSGWITWTVSSIDPNNGTATRWFSGTLGCVANSIVTNQHYRVDSSDQGVTSTDGISVSFAIAAPTITTDFSRTPDPILAGQTLNFTGIASTNGTPLSYAWNFGDGAQGTGLNATHAYTRHGTYTVVFTATDGCGYVGTQTHLVTVNAPTLTANFTQSATSIIVNNTVRFTDTSTTNGPGLVGWLWTFGDGAISSAQYPTHLYTTVGVYNVTLLITDSLGYTATHSVPNAVNVTSGCIPLTSADFTYAPLKPLIHGATTFTATSAPANATQPLAYAWNFGDGGTTSQSTPTVSHAYQITGTRTVTLTVSNACTTPGLATSHAITIQPYGVYLPLIVKKP